MALITQAEVEARLGRAMTAEEVSAFSIRNSALQAKIERMIGSGVESVSATTRYFDGGHQHTRIDPCTSITSIVQVDDDLVSIYTYDTTDYQTEPANQTLKRMIRHRSGPLMRGINNIAVTAKFSIFEDTGMLNIVKDAMLDVLSGEIEGTGNIKSESIEGYRVDRFNDVETEALDKIKYHFPGV